MKKISLLVVTAFATVIAFGQQNHVSWTYEAKKKSVGIYEVVITAELDDSWHIYSQHTGKGGPIPTKIVFKTNPLITKTGPIKELGKLEKHYDENFKTDVLYFSDKVQFVQTVKIKGNVKTNIAGTVEYMVCDDSQCLPPTKKTFNLKLM